jgi:hypothetical protein
MTALSSTCSSVCMCVCRQQGVPCKHLQGSVFKNPTHTGTVMAHKEASAERVYTHTHTHTHARTRTHTYAHTHAHCTHVHTPHTHPTRTHAHTHYVTDRRAARVLQFVSPHLFPARVDHVSKSRVHGPSSRCPHRDGVVRSR